MRITTSLAAAAAAVVAALALSACSGDEPADSSTPVDRGTSETTPSVQGSPEASPTATSASEEADPTSPLLSVSIDGDEVLPNAEAIDLAVGEELLIEVVSDRPGELHVHAKPEQFIEFGAGTTNTKLVIDTPGSVEIEDHDTGAVVALLEVR